jgi:hypothetical protein
VTSNQRRQVVSCSDRASWQIVLERHSDHLTVDVLPTSELPVVLSWNEAMLLSQKLKRMARIVAMIEAVK